MSAGSGAPWLDALARRAARGESAAGDAVHAAPNRAREGGLSRRTLLRTACAAVLLNGPLRLLVPTAAHAQDSAACIRERSKENATKLQECLQKPNADYRDITESIRSATVSLRAANTAADRKRLQKRINDLTARQARAARAQHDCVVSFVNDQSQATFNCTVVGPTQPQQPGDAPGQSPVGPSPACPPNTFACPGDATACCYDGTFCCGCGICCIYKDCRCCG